MKKSNKQDLEVLTQSLKMRGDTDNVVLKGAVDVILIGAVVALHFIISSVLTPYESGFFCNDESLMLPSVPSTVSLNTLFTVGLGVPLLTIILVEITRMRKDNEHEMTIFGIEIPFWAQNTVKYVGLFVFGLACNQLAADIGKFTLGRFRPHFFDVCKPIMTNNTTCSDPSNLNRYITEFTCANTLSEGAFKNLRLSFPSGHSSYAFYCMMFASLYLQYRMTWNGSKLFKHVLQFTFVMMAWFFAVTRVSNNKHHWSDVIFGSLQGIMFCCLIIYGISDLFRARCSKRELKTIRYQLEPETVHVNNA